MTNAINSVAGVDDFATMVKDLMAERDKLQADLAAARKEIRRTHDDAEMLISTIATLRQDLAAARAESDMAHWLLRNARKYMNPMHEALCAAIDNALQKKQAAIVMERSEVAGEDLAVPSGGLEGDPEEERIEAAYWRFDARHKGYGQWKNAPMSERDAFKAEMRNALGAEKTRAEMRLAASGWRKPAALAGQRREGE